MRIRTALICLITGCLLASLPTLGQSTDTKATLIIVDGRDPALWDYRVHFFDENGTKVGTMKQCQILWVSMTPGPHKFRSNKGKKPAISINALAGETYYAEAGIKNWTIPQMMRFEFELISRQEAESWVAKCKLPASSLDEVPITKPQP